MSDGASASWPQDPDLSLGKAKPIKNSGSATVHHNSATLER